MVCYNGEITLAYSVCTLVIWWQLWSVAGQMLNSFPASTAVIDSQIRSGGATRLSHAPRLTDMYVWLLLQATQGAVGHAGAGLHCTGRTGCLWPLLLAT